MKRTWGILGLLLGTTCTVFATVQLIGWGRLPFPTSSQPLPHGQIKLLLGLYILVGAASFTGAMLLLIRRRSAAIAASITGLLLLACCTFYIAFTLAFEF